MPTYFVIKMENLRARDYEFCHAVQRPCTLGVRHIHSLWALKHCAGT